MRSAHSRWISVSTLVWALAALGCGGGGGGPTSGPTGGQLANQPSSATGATPESAAAGATATGNIDPSGFTKFESSSDSQIVYVSSSSGNDANVGTEAAPVKTIEKAKSLLRTGYPDWMLLKSGDTWDTGLGQWMKGGRSATEPMVVSSYGTGARPKLEPPLGEHGLRATGAGNSPESMDNLAFVGLHFYSPTHDPNNPAYSDPAGAYGIFWLRGAKNVMVEDCVVEMFGNGMVWQATDGFPQSNVHVHRNVILDSWGEHYAQSMYVDSTTSIFVEENVIIHKGWDARAPTTQPSIFTHAIYVQSNANGVTVKNNVILNGTSHCLQLRPGGTAEGNFCARNAIGILAGGGDSPTPGGITASVKNNVIIEGTDISSDVIRGWGIDLANVKSVAVEGNIVAHAIGLDPGTPIKIDPNATYKGNIVHDWGKNPDSPAGPFTDPNRGTESYSLARGGAGTYDDFMHELRLQSKARWRTDYMAQAINEYIRAGFQ